MNSVVGNFVLVLNAYVGFFKHRFHVPALSNPWGAMWASFAEPAVYQFSWKSVVVHSAYMAVVSELMFK